MTISSHLHRPAGCFLLVLMLTGCGGKRIYEVSTAGAEHFDWTGKVRIVETSASGPFGASPYQVSRMELLGKGGRNVLIEPYSGDRGHLLIATVADNYRDAVENDHRDTVDDDHRDISQVLDTRIREKHGAQLRVPGVGGPHGRLSPSLESVTHIDKGEFDQMDSSELLREAVDTIPVEAVYEIDARYRLRVKNQSDGYCVASIESPDGKVLHTWAPQRLDMTVKKE